MRGLLLVATALFVTWAAADTARAQDFFGGGGAAAFDPEISVVTSGAKLDVQATVSADRKYVTLTARPDVSQLLALQQFVFQGPPGVIGFNNGGGAGGGGAGNNNAPDLPPRNNVRRDDNADRNAAGNPPAGNRTAANRRGPLLPALARPAEPKNAETPVLHREGMTRIDEPAPAAPADPTGRPAAAPARGPAARPTGAGR